jgi:outer membrane protein OmpA-like peptidoglycan-associated protein
MKHFLVAACLLLLQSAVGQKIVKDHYTVSAGILGAANFTNFSIKDNSNLDYSTQFGWGAGGYINFPLGKVISFEPQFMYNQYAYQTDATALLNDSKASYFSIPVLLKFHLGSKFAITAGPQFDFLTSVNDNNNIWDKEDVTKSSVAINGGFELFPHGRVVPFARYIYGFTNMDNTGNPNTVGEYHNQNFQVGLKLRLIGGKHILADSDGDGVVDKDDKCPAQVGLARYNGCPIPDTDGDGFNDEVDKCPTVAGIEKYGGCPIPDTDKDGINDEQDKCPTVAGLAKYNGCPIPDTDGDGINDEEDKCPSVAGLAKYNGCPIPDTDGDGINDEEDRCPDIAGVAEMMGCPAIDYQAHEVLFQSGKSALLPSGKKELDNLVNFLNKNPNVKITLEGHTDITGTDKINDPLSVKRAESAKAYLVSKGIDESRMGTTGYGSKQPIADNKTKDGKAKNRRIELKVQ